MPKRALAAVSALIVALPFAVATSATARTLKRDGVTATVTASGASLRNGRVSRTWRIEGGSVETTSLRGAREWAKPGPDFALDIDGIPTSSTTWMLKSVQAAAPPALPGRPASGRGAALLFEYTLLDPIGVELTRLVTLHPGSAVIETTSTLLNLGPIPIRVASYTLDQIVAANANMPAEVHAYNGGSDWRDDYRHISQPSGAFDVEGEVARFGSDSGFFFVSQRRGGAMSRAGRAADGRSWVGSDWARDLFDLGPLADTPPNYNRLENPVYPVPVRARLLAPLGSLDLGTAFTGVYAGGAQEAAANFARDFVGDAMPAFARSVGINTFHPWSHGDGMSDPNLRAQVDAAAAMGIERFMLDDQWQGGPGGESGDWRFDAARFPDKNTNSTPDFVEYVHAKGLKLALWMSPLEFHMTSSTYAAHPDWACFPVGDVTAQVEDDAGLGVWDATNAAFQDYIVGVVDRLVHDYDVREFKFDFMAWVDCPPHDYADYEDAFVQIVHRMQAHHPHVTFELDETNDQRSWPFESAQIGPSWFDNKHLHGSGPVAKLLHDVWSASPWIPTWGLGLGTYDGTLADPYGVDFLFPLAMLTHITFWTDLTKIAPADRAETAWWIDWYRAHRTAIGPAVYELTTADPIDGKTWTAWEPWTGTSGYVFAFRQSGGPAAERLQLRGVDARARYVVRNVRTGTVVGTFSGAALAAGLSVSLAPSSAAVLSVRAV
jgi:hypothetical protein